MYFLLVNSSEKELLEHVLFERVMRSLEFFLDSKKRGNDIVIHHISTRYQYLLIIRDL